jgi:hypothetical protein
MAQPQPYSARERQKIIEDTIAKLVEIIHSDASKGEPFRQLVLNKIVTNLDGILNSEAAKTEIKMGITSGIANVLQNPDYMNPLLFRSILTMGSTLPIIQNAFNESLALTSGYGGEGTKKDKFIHNLEIVLSGKTKAQRGGSKAEPAPAAAPAGEPAAATEQDVEKELLELGADPKDIEDAKRIAKDQNINISKALAKKGITIEKLKQAAEAAKTAGVDAKTAEAAVTASTGLSKEELKAGVELANASGVAPPDGAGAGAGASGAEAPATSGSDGKGSDMGKKASDDLSGAMKGLRNWTVSTGSLADANQMTEGVLLEDLLKGLDYRSNQMTQSIFDSVKSAIVKHVDEGGKEIIKSIGNAMQTVSNELSQKLSQEAYTLYVYGMLNQNKENLYTAIHAWVKWVDQNGSKVDQNGSKVDQNSFDFSSISSETSLNYIINHMKNKNQTTASNKEGGSSKVSRIYGGNSTKKYLRSKKHPLFKIKSTRRRKIK